ADSRVRDSKEQGTGARQKAVARLHLLQRSAANWFSCFDRDCRETPLAGRNSFVSSRKDFATRPISRGNGITSGRRTSGGRKSSRRPSFAAFSRTTNTRRSQRGRCAPNNDHNTA